MKSSFPEKQLRMIQNLKMIPASLVGKNLGKKSSGPLLIKLQMKKLLPIWDLKSV